MHTPFFGFDNVSAVKQMDPRFSYNGTSEYDMRLRYKIISKFFDQNLGKTLEMIKDNFSHSILVVVGDHGPREVP